MKNVSLLLLSVLLFASASAQRTLYTSGIGSGRWSDPQSWLDSPEGATVSQAPAATDHVVVRHYLTQTLSDTYIHTGNIRIEAGGVLELVEKNSSSYTFAGARFEVLGGLICTGDFTHQRDSSAATGLLVVGATAQVVVLGDLTLEGEGGLLVDNASCGAFAVVGDLLLHGANTYVCGQGKVIVGDELRVWDGSFEVEHPTARTAVLAARTCETIRYFASETDCSLDSAIVTGNGVFNQDIVIDGLRAEPGSAGVTLSWKVAAPYFQDRFTVERSRDGRFFEAIEAIEVTDACQHTYAALDTAQVGTRYYRVKMTLRDGSYRYSGLVDVATADVAASLLLYPNPASQEAVSVQGADFEANEPVSLVVRNTLGQVVAEASLTTDARGTCTSRLAALERGTYFVSLATARQQQTSLLRVH
ncbi:MAG: hypothetical protein OHK0039_20740 [Bacteroidia bacterium]